MAEQTLFSEVRDLVGKRSDDPAVLAFHEAHKLSPPPAVMRTGLLYDVKVGNLGVSLDYGAELRTAQHWPPRRVAGRYVAYVTSATFKPTFPGLLANGLSPTLPLTTAKNKAIESTKNEAFYFNVMHRDDRCTLTYVYDRDDKSLLEIRLQHTELPEDHKAIVRAEAVEYGSTSGKPTFPKIARLAATLSKRDGRSPLDVLAAAADQYLDIHERMSALIKHESP